MFIRIFYSNTLFGPKYRVQQFETRCKPSDAVFHADHEFVLLICCGALCEELQRFSCPHPILKALFKSLALSLATISIIIVTNGISERWVPARLPLHLCTYDETSANCLISFASCANTLWAELAVKERDHVPALYVCALEEFVALPGFL
ncbi:hypothetical protein Y032_0131g1586 [Ancylostoma ceylanicum]|uniref:Uncharacterized protein n=1 Tax=Ancylostoma ceylanicum TaxID=53326 RepID=A0A016T6M3_9BILA|nr:hypothetical protein Y032_0131g1586 [Ancylostoma ceylanicum]